MKSSQAGGAVQMNAQKHDTVQCTWGNNGRLMVEEKDKHGESWDMGLEMQGESPF